MTQDEICPAYVGEDRIRVSLSEDTLAPSAFAAVDVAIDYSAADVDGGVQLPIEITVTAPNPTGFVRKTYRSNRPTLFTFKPREGGDHLVRVREVAHNRWFGVLRVSVAGDRLNRRGT
ncbi:MAG TPA: hypothetical protein VFB99_24385 [Vicinamibacterales bacterium]|nr:hypothetical protein [Vicinamibacterales bacterium]